MKNAFCFAGIMLLLASCGNQAPQAFKVDADSTVIPPAALAVREDTGIINDRQTLIGSWISDDDPLYGLIITKEHYIETTGAQSIDTSRYILSRKSCESSAVAGNEEGAYLAVIDEFGDQMCYSVTALNAQQFSMIYLSGNGTISSYHRGK